MHNKYRYLCLSFCVALPTAACDLPEKIVGETADPADQEPENEESPQDEPKDEEPPQDEPKDEEPPQDEPPPDEEPPQDEPPNVDLPAAEPTIVASIAGTIAVDDTWLFIGSGAQGNNVPYRVLKSGGVPEPVAPAASVETYTNPALLALDDTHVYWVADGGPCLCSTGFGLLRAPKTGGEATLVTAEPGPNLASPAAFVVDDEYVYVTLPDIYNTNNPVEQYAGVVRRVPKAGGPALDIAKEYASSVAVSDTSVYWPRFRVGGGGELVRADKDGANAEVVDVQLGPIYEVLVKGNRLYWSSYDSGQYKVHTALEGEAATTLFSESAEKFFVGTPAVTADALYWLNGGDADFGKINTVDLAGTVSELVTAPASSSYTGFWGAYGTRIAADETAVYWAYETGLNEVSRIYRIAR